MSNTVTVCRNGFVIVCTLHNPISYLKKGKVKSKDIPVTARGGPWVARG
jgi:hypothetical protein